MTRAQICEENSHHFPEDAAWQSHCQKMARMREAELRPLGLAGQAAAKLDAFEPIGRAA